MCLWSRLASRITLVVRRVNAGDANLLYEGIRRIPWHEVIAPGASIAVHAHGMNDELRNTHFTELKVKDGICDALRERTGARPNVDSADPDASIDVRVRENRATISLDLSGESLYARAYLEPDAGQDAPLECALSAGALAMAQWDESCKTAALVDPACGDGSLVVEAAGMWLATWCWLGARSRWGFEGWAAFDEDVGALARRGRRALRGRPGSSGAASARPALRASDRLDLERVRCGRLHVGRFLHRLRPHAR